MLRFLRARQGSLKLRPVIAPEKDVFFADNTPCSCFWSTSLIYSQFWKTLVTPSNQIQPHFAPARCWCSRQDVRKCYEVQRNTQPLMYWKEQNSLGFWVLNLWPQAFGVLWVSCFPGGAKELVTNWVSGWITRTIGLGLRWRQHYSAWNSTGLQQLGAAMCVNLLKVFILLGAVGVGQIWLPYGPKNRRIILAAMFDRGWSLPS